jgi:hypothetical protein
MDSSFAPTQLDLATRELPVMTISQSRGDISPAFHPSLADALVRAHGCIEAAGRSALAPAGSAHVQIYVCAEGGYRLQHSIKTIAEVEQLMRERAVAVPAALRAA